MQVTVIYTVLGHQRQLGVWDKSDSQDSLGQERQLGLVWTKALVRPYLGQCSTSYALFETNSVVRPSLGQQRWALFGILVLFRPCLGFFALMSPFLYSIFLTHLLLSLCPLASLASPLLFPYARYPVGDAHLVHGIPVPCSQSMIDCPLFLWSTLPKRRSVAINR